MYLSEMLTTENPENITDKELREASYGLTYGEFDLELLPRQQMLQKRLEEIQAAKKAALPQKSQLPPIESDPYCDEYAWS